MQLATTAIDIAAIDTPSPEEWAVRVNLAAMYRLAALNGWDDLIFTHISARVPGPDHHFLINPLGLMFEEITASSLIKIDLDANIIAGPQGARVNGAGFVIHSAIHAARDDANYVIHLHTTDGIAVSAQPEGLLPISQFALGIIPMLSYHDYEGVALDLDECERLVADLGDRTMMILRHHGTLALGPTAGVAWLSMYGLERACAVQVRALSAGRHGIDLAPVAAQDKVGEQVTQDLSAPYKLGWDALLRKLQRTAPGFDS